MGLDGLLRHRAHDADAASCNGIDDALWNPATDAHLAAHFDAAHRAARAANRKALRARIGLADDAGRAAVRRGEPAYRGRRAWTSCSYCVPDAARRRRAARGARQRRPGSRRALRRRARAQSGPRRRAHRLRRRISRISCRPAPMPFSSRRGSSRAASRRCARCATARCRSSRTSADSPTPSSMRNDVAIAAGVATGVPVRAGERRAAAFAIDRARSRCGGSRAGGACRRGR